MMPAACARGITRALRGFHPWNGMGSVGWLVVGVHSGPMSSTVKQTPDNAGGKRIGTGLPGPGRPPGSPNKATRAFREVIAQLLEDNADNVALWLQQTAEGSKSRKVGGKTVPGRPPNPSEAARILGNLAEFAAPRLSRAEVTGEGGGPLTVVINRSGRKPQEPASDPE